MDVDPTIAFAVRDREPPAIEVRVNFGVVAGRAATPAEIDRLAEWLLDEVEDVSIIAEERHEIDAHGEASVHQVVIEISDGLPANSIGRRELEERVLERAQYWARQCVADRHADVAEI